MKSIRLFFLVLLFFCLNSISLGQNNVKKKTVHLFKMFTTEETWEEGEEYTSMLIDILKKTEMVNIVEVINVNPVLDTEVNIYKNVKQIIKDKCPELYIESAVFGYILKKEKCYIVYAELYNAKNDEVITRCREVVYFKSHFKSSVKNCAVNIAGRLQEINVARITFNSALIPGLGLMKLKKFGKAALYFGGFLGLIIIDRKYGNDLLPYDRTKFSKSFAFSRQNVIPDAPPQYYDYYIDGILTPIDEWLEKRAVWSLENEETKIHNDKLEAKRSKLRLGIVILYIANIIDTAVSAKSLSNRSQLEDKVSFDFLPLKRRPTIKFNYHF